jgi:branched-chain amino acid transport system permease protein
VSAAGTSLAVTRATRASRIAAPIALALFLGLASFPLWAEAGWMREFDEMACYFLFALMWNLLAGHGGMVSIGQQAYFGIGGYSLLVMGDHLHLNPFAAVPLAALVALAVAVPVSFVAFRLRGGYFAIGTWVISEVFRISVANVAAVGGGSGTSLTALRGISRTTRESTTFLLCLSFVAAATAIVYAVLRSREGLALFALRDSETAAESQGVNVPRTRLFVYLVASAGAGLAGALYFLGNLRISPDAAFSVNWTAFAIFIVLVGGVGTLEGTIVGVVLFYLLSKLFSDYGTWYLVGLGLLAVAVTIKLPRGLWGTVSGKLDLHLFPVQRRLDLTQKG